MGALGPSNNNLGMFTLSENRHRKRVGSLYTEGLLFCRKNTAFWM